MNGKDKVMRRKEAFFAVVGGVVGAVLTMATGLFSPLGVQSQAMRNFGKITCTELEVVRPDGTQGAWIYANDDGGRVIVYGRNGTLKKSVNLMYGNGGFVGVFGSNGTTQAGMGVWEGEKGESGGHIHVWGSDKLRGLDFSTFVGWALPTSL